MPEIIKVKDTRRAFIDALIELAEKDPLVCLIVPDVGFNYIEEFQKKFPKRYFNLGVTEQSCILIATAMALDGWHPFVYSMINFVLFRPAEMVRNGPVVHKAPVVLLGVQGGPSYRFLGAGHNLLHDKEDFTFCENIGLAWKHPQSNEEVREDVLSAYASGAGCYIRL